MHALWYPIWSLPEGKGLPRTPCHTYYQNETSGMFSYISKNHQQYLGLHNRIPLLQWDLIQHIKRNSHAKNDQAIFACYEYYKSDERHINRKFHTIVGKSNYLFFFFYFFILFLCFSHFFFFSRYFVAINPQDFSFFSFFLWHLISSFSVRVFDRARNCFAFY